MPDTTLYALIVDDDATVRATTARALEGLGLATVLAASGEEALRVMATRRFSLVVTDFEMPGMNGIDLLNEIRRLQPGVPAVMMSGVGTFDVLCASRVAGALDYLPKPCGVDVLQRVAKRVLGTRFAS